MPFYMRKSVKIAPGLHLNFSKRGMGMSVGKRGGPRVTLGPTGRVTASQSFGGGLRYQQSVNLHSAKRVEANEVPAEVAATNVVKDDVEYRGHAHVEHYGFWTSYLVWGVILQVVATSYKTTIPDSTLYWVIQSVSGFCLFIFVAEAIDNLRKKLKKQ